ncbi:MAG: DUF1801 domain-containing protein [Bacteroidetes bacterium]|nr:DUF1801 domain-containing protein [Bacteroidota bacterium]
MAELKTKPNNQNVDDFLKKVSDPAKRKNCHRVLDIMKQITQQEPKMWGDSMVGFGNYHYQYTSGREGNWFLTGFSPRKQSLTIYIMSGFDQFEHLMSQLGKYKNSKSCLYVKKLDDIDLGILKELIAESIKLLSKRYS